MKFYLDEHFSTTVAEMARLRGLDVVTSHERGRDGIKDEEQLTLAAGEDRCFVTLNTSHLMQVTVRFFQDERPHSGLLNVPHSLSGRRRFATLVEALVAYDRDHPEGVPAYTIDYLHG